MRTIAHLWTYLNSYKSEKHRCIYVNTVVFENSVYGIPRIAIQIGKLMTNQQIHSYPMFTITHKYVYTYIYIYIHIHCCGISVKSKDTFHLMSSIAWLCKHITHQIKASKQCKAKAEFVCQLNQLNWMKVSVDHIISHISLLRSTVVPSFRSSKWHGIPWHRCN